jgi:uncharacterized repeat protein (TIGR01451 family)
VGHLVDGVSAAELERHICRLQDRDALSYCNTQGSRHAWDLPALQEAAAYIRDHLAAQGLEVSMDPFQIPAPDAPSGVVISNVVATLQGVAPPAERRVLIISAHYDSTAGDPHEWEPGDRAPGADDNASGVAALLEAARLLSDWQFYHTVRFIAFAGEELGLLGSRHYAAQARARGEDIAGVINLDMIGYESDGVPWFEIHAGLDPWAVEAAAIVSRTVAAYDLDLLPQVLTEEAIGLSDHQSFWEAGFPALLLIEDTELRGPTADWNPYYHTEQDTLDKLNRRYLAELTRATVGALGYLARPMAPDLQVRVAGPATVAPGAPMSFTLSFANAGIERASNVVVTATLSSGLVYASDSSGLPRVFGPLGSVSWPVGDLAPGEGSDFVVTATVATHVPRGAVVFSRVVVGSPSLDADAADNLAEFQAVIRPVWRLYLPVLIRLPAAPQTRSAAD